MPSHPPRTLTHKSTPTHPPTPTPTNLPRASARTATSTASPARPTPPARSPWAARKTRRGTPSSSSAGNCASSTITSRKVRFGQRSPVARSLTPGGGNTSYQRPLPLLSPHRIIPHHIAVVGLLFWAVAALAGHLKGVNPNQHGMVESIVCTRAKAFAGAPLPPILPRDSLCLSLSSFFFPPSAPTPAGSLPHLPCPCPCVPRTPRSGTYYSTFTGYIHRLRGYHGLGESTYYHTTGKVRPAFIMNAPCGPRRPSPADRTSKDLSAAVPGPLAPFLTHLPLPLHKTRCFTRKWPSRWATGFQGNGGQGGQTTRGGSYSRYC